MDVKNALKRVHLIFFISGLAILNQRYSLINSELRKRASLKGPNRDPCYLMNHPSIRSIETKVPMFSRPRPYNPQTTHS
jgi:hypothetical protein